MRPAGFSDRPHPVAATLLARGCPKLVGVKDVSEQLQERLSGLGE
jgi:hypothetical protein